MARLWRVWYWVVDIAEVVAGRLCHHLLNRHRWCPWNTDCYWEGRR